MITTTEIFYMPMLAIIATLAVIMIRNSRLPAKTAAYTIYEKFSVKYQPIIKRMDHMRHNLKYAVRVLVAAAFFALQASAQQFVEISTPAELKALGNGQLLTGTYVLKNDIDMSGTTFEPIGTYQNPFKGRFDGKGFVVKNLYVSKRDTTVGRVGLFGQIDAVGVVENLGVIGADVTGGFAVGALAGVNNGRITGCYSAGKVEAVRGQESNAGGLVGYNGGRIERSYSSAAVTGGDNVGGLVGFLTVVNNHGVIRDCYAVGNARGNNNVGGLVGYVFGGTVERSYSMARLSKSTANAEGRHGGLIGTEFIDGKTANNVVGRNPATGEFVKAAVINNCFWDMDVSGITTSSGGGTQTPKTTEEMTDPQTFTSRGWDVVTVDKYNPDAPSAKDGQWVISEGTGLPQLTIPDIIPIYTVTYTIDATAETQGSVTVNGNANAITTADAKVNTTVAAASVAAEVKAVPKTGYEFEKWVDQNGETVSTDSVLTFVATGNITIAPVFIKAGTVVVQPKFCDYGGGTCSQIDANLSEEQCEANGGSVVSSCPVVKSTNVITVAKSGTRDYDLIQQAVNAANPGDTILILDTAVYNEQVTIMGATGYYGFDIDSSLYTFEGVGIGKYSITLRYGGTGTAKPTIKWRDTVNTSPKDTSETKNFGFVKGTAGNFETNGALRILRTTGITIENIKVDGGSPYPFVGVGVWSGGYNQAHGNAAITLSVAGNVQIRDCELVNSYIGINVKDRNPGGVFANANANDIDYSDPLSKFGMVGNHLFEYNKIYNNHVGMFFESLWDLGSSVRYNLFYNNTASQSNCGDYTTSSSFCGVNTSNPSATYSSGDLVPAAIKFKDNYLAPVAIYNNTFHGNYANLYGNWKVGYQHLIFNNIFGDITLGNDNFGDGGSRIEGKYTHRMKNCVFTGNIYQIPEGSPAMDTLTAANVSQGVSLSFINDSDPTSSDFLDVNWSSASVSDAGWAAVGNAVIGAIQPGGKIPGDGKPQTSPRLRIPPVSNVLITNNTARIKMNVTQEGSGTVNDLKIKYLRWIAPIPDNSALVSKSGDASWGADGTAIPVNAISIIQDAEGTSVNIGYNDLSFPIPVATASAEYGFFEIVLEGTDEAGNPVYSDVGFLPYRRYETSISMPIDAAALETVDDVKSEIVPDAPQPAPPALSKLSVGPNPASSEDGDIALYWEGNEIKSASLSVYSVSGSLVGRLSVRDPAAGLAKRGYAAPAGSRRVGEWSLRDRRSRRRVSSGTYLVRGTVKTVDGRREKVSVIVGVR